MWKLFVLAVASLLLGACATVPQPLMGQYSMLPPNQAANASGERVRWGGTIIETVPEANQTCIYTMSRPLGDSARPYPSGDGGGRFVACHAGFYDPQIFAPGREITVTGSIDGSLTRAVGEYEYAYPRVQADVIYLWPRRIERPYYYDPYPGYFYDPFWGPPGWGYFAPRPVIVVPVRPHHHHRSSH
ncbi:MAG TPA: Slp family lipoprotein [Rhodanobacteraceae bacterium]|nr:Slp family lipoprotein [Rhodanobacteraceae bacterium]